MHPKIKLKIKVHGRHPWFYRKMIRRPDRPIAAGSAVLVHDREDKFVGTGFYNGRTEKALRILDRSKVTDPRALVLARVKAAIEYRDHQLTLPKHTDAYRLVHSEGDGIPGLVLDRLGRTIVAQLRSLCMQQHIEEIGELLLERYPGARLLLTVDETARKLERMDSAPPITAKAELIEEQGIAYELHPGLGHKTGFFADQRDNRMLVRKLAKGRRVLDLCCNSGGFAMNALRGGARKALALDLDEKAVAQGKANSRRNQLPCHFEHGDAFEFLRDSKPGAFNFLILDPPRWAAHKDQAEAALHRYRDLNALAFAKAEAGSLILTCSCSGPISEDRFLSTLRQAASDAGRDLRIRHIGGAGPDHPIALECPETRYLKVVLLQVR